MDPNGYDLKVPATLTTPADRARFCRDRAEELIKGSVTEYDEGAKFEMLNLAERWLTRAFHYRRQTN
jgi:hypothetical protein